MAFVCTYIFHLLIVIEFIMCCLNVIQTHLTGKKYNIKVFDVKVFLGNMLHEAKSKEVFFLVFF